MKKSTIIILVSVLLIAIIIAGLCLWYQPHKKVEQAEGIIIHVDSLCSLYDKGEQEANSLLLNKAVITLGRVDELIHNLEGGIMVVISSADGQCSIQCTLRERDVPVKTGDVIRVKGFCAGRTLTGIALTDCVLTP